MLKRFCTVAWLLAAVACGAVPAFAQDTPHALDFKVPMTLFLAGAALDDASTMYSLHHGATEGNPMFFFLRDKPNTIGTIAVLRDALTVWAVQHFKGKHPKLAKTFLYAAASIRLSCGARNLVTLNVLPLLPAR